MNLPASATDDAITAEYSAPSADPAPSGPICRHAIDRFRRSHGRATRSDALALLTQARPDSRVSYVEGARTAD